MTEVKTRKVRFEMDVAFDVPETVDLCRNENDEFACEGDCGSDCAIYFNKRLKAYLNNETSEGSTQLWSSGFYQTIFGED